MTQAPGPPQPLLPIGKIRANLAHRVAVIDPNQGLETPHPPPLRHRANMRRNQHQLPYLATLLETHNHPPLSMVPMEGKLDNLLLPINIAQPQTHLSQVLLKLGYAEAISHEVFLLSMH